MMTGFSETSAKSHELTEKVSLLADSQGTKQATKYVNTTFM
jgi:hypothetical protein